MGDDTDSIEVGGGGRA